MEVVGEFDEEFSVEDFSTAVLDVDADVALLDLGDPQTQRPGGLLGSSDYDVAAAILQRLPNLIVVALESMGRRAIVHSAVTIDDVGLETLFDTIRSAASNTTATRNT